MHWNGASAPSFLRYDVLERVAHGLAGEAQSLDHSVIFWYIKWLLSVHPRIGPGLSVCWHQWEEVRVESASAVMRDVRIASRSVHLGHLSAVLQEETASSDWFASSCSQWDFRCEEFLLFGWSRGIQRLIRNFWEDLASDIHPIEILSVGVLHSLKGLPSCRVAHERDETELCSRL